MDVLNAFDSYLTIYLTAKQMRDNSVIKQTDRVQQKDSKAAL